MEFSEWFGIIMQILGGMGAFLIGMSSLSDNMTRLAHGKLRAMLNKTSKNRWAGVGIGAAVTMIAQSSALTTVMVVGLVNAGIMTLFQGTAIIMGANVGTTITAWLVSLKGFSVSTIALGMTAVGVFMKMFSSKEKIKSIGSALAGLGLIFVGLEFMQGAFDSDGFKVIVSDALTVVTNPFLLLLIGIVVTALVQSSSAVTAIVITLATAGIVIGGEGGDGVYYVVIGSNIGTCVTALLSAIGASTNARRAAVIHFLFNFFGAIIFMVILMLWRYVGCAALGWKGFGQILNEGIPGHPETQIAIFHTLFNVLCTLAFLPFINGFVKLSNILVRDKKTGKEEESSIVELDERLLRQPSVALGRFIQETGTLYSYCKGTMDLAFQAFLDKDESKKETVVKREEIAFKTNKEMVSYLVKMSGASLVLEEERTISSLHYVLNDVMRVVELADNITKYTAHYVNDELIFSEEVLQDLQEMYHKISSLYAKSLEIFLTKNVEELAELDGMEDSIDKTRRMLVSEHISRLNEGKCQPQNSSVFINLVGNLERAADHMAYVAHAVEQMK